jgi:hypothetical protein
MHYLSGRIPELPWLIDSVVPAGKLAYERARTFDLRTEEAITVGNVLRIPLYLDGNNPGPLSIAFDAGVPIDQVELANKESMLALAHGSRVAIAGSVDASSAEPIGWITIPRTVETLLLRDIEFNGERQPDKLIRIAGNEPTEITITATPNPFTSNTTILVTVPETGMYTVNVYNASGERIATLASGQLNKGTVPLIWNGTDERGVALPSGTYFCRLEGSGVGHVVAKVVLER